MRGRLAAHHWLGVLVAAIVVSATGILARHGYVELPLVRERVKVPSLLTFVSPLLVFGPLVSAMPELEPGLVRERATRVLRVAAVVTLTVATMVPMWAMSWAGFRELCNRVLPIFLVLLIVAVLGVAGLDRLGWLPTMAAIAMFVILDTGRDMPVTTRLDRLPFGVLVLGLVAAAAVYVWRGPRHQT